MNHDGACDPTFVRMSGSRDAHDLSVEATLVDRPDQLPPELAALIASELARLEGHARPKVRNLADAALSTQIGALVNPSLEPALTACLPVDLGLEDLVEEDLRREAVAMETAMRPAPEVLPLPESAILGDEPSGEPMVLRVAEQADEQGDDEEDELATVQAYDELELPFAPTLAPGGLRVADLTAALPPAATCDLRPPRAAPAPVAVAVDPHQVTRTFFRTDGLSELVEKAPATPNTSGSVRVDIPRPDPSRVPPAIRPRTPRPDVDGVGPTALVGPEIAPQRFIKTRVGSSEPRPAVIAPEETGVAHTSAELVGYGPQDATGILRVEGDLPASRMVSPVLVMALGVVGLVAAVSQML